MPLAVHFQIVPQPFSTAPSIHTYMHSRHSHMQHSHTTTKYIQHIMYTQTHISHFQTHKHTHTIFIVKRSPATSVSMCKNTGWRKVNRNCHNLSKNLSQKISSVKDCIFSNLLKTLITLFITSQSFKSANVLLFCCWRKTIAKNILTRTMLTF